MAHRLAVASAAAVALLVGLPSCSKPAAPAASPSEATSASSSSVSARIGGCRDVYLYAANDESTEVVIVDVDARTVGLARGQRKTFDLSRAPSGVKVWLDVYLHPAHVENVHCTMTPTEAQMAERYAATAGRLSIERAPDGSVTARVEGATFILDGRPAIEVAERRFERVRLAGSSS